MFVGDVVVRRKEKGQSKKELNTAMKLLFSLSHSNLGFTKNLPSFFSRQIFWLTFWNGNPSWCHENSNFLLLFTHQKYLDLWKSGTYRVGRGSVGWWSHIAWNNFLIVIQAAFDTKFFASCLCCKSSVKLLLIFNTHWKLIEVQKLSKRSKTWFLFLFLSKADALI